MWKQLCFSPYSPSQLWGVIKQGYRCKGDLLHSILCNISMSIFSQMSVSIMLTKWGEVHTVSCGEQVKWSYLRTVLCGFLCCTQLAEPCSTWKKMQPEPQFSPSPIPQKIWELFVCLTLSMQRPESCICSRDSVQRKVSKRQYVDVRPTLVLVFTCCALFLTGADCGMNCHRLCKDQVAFECKKNAKVTNANDSPTLSSTPVTMGTSEGGFGQRGSLPA